MQIEYGIRIKIDGNQAAVVSFDEIGNANRRAAAAAVEASKEISQAQQEVASSAARVVAAQSNIAESYVKAGSASQQAAQKMATEQQGLSTSTAQLTREQQRFIDQLQRKAEAIGKTNSQLAMLRAQELGVSDAAGPLIARLASVEGGMNRVGMSSAATAAAMRNVPAQFTDIVTSLQGGQAPMTVLLQQGGQLKDMFGGVGNAASALGRYVLSLISPMTALAAATAVVGYAAYQGSQEFESYQRAIIMTGNAAGVTAGQLASMAAKINESGRGTTGAAAEAITALVSAGRISSENLERFAGSALKAQKTLGIGVEDTAKVLSELGKTPLETSRKLSEQYGYLTKESYDRIKALVEQGKSEEAAAAAQAAYVEALDKKSQDVEKTLGSFQRGWNSVKNSAKSAWDAMLGLGRDEQDTDKLKRVQTMLANKEASLLEKQDSGDTSSKIYKKLLLEIEALKIRGDVKILPPRVTITK